MSSSDVLSKLVEMSRSLGQPERDFVILGEGNTSARAGEGSFWVKASGFSLHTIPENGFVELCFEPVLGLIDRGAVADADFTGQLEKAKVDPGVRVRPSVEATMHAIIYHLCGADFIGHTHPTAVNAILCSADGPDLLRGRLFPDHIVFCGRVPVVIPYVEPGLPLARAIKHALEDHLDQYGEAPKTIFMQNHGLIALAKTAGEVESITAMCVKACRVLQGAAALGGVRFMTQADVDRIHTHPSELYRRQQAGF
jgi:rhamnose utilization protein RhaD (predicted bifunctional aldolase and dehydrogenase)